MVGDDGATGRSRTGVTTPIEIDGRPIGPGHPTFVVAELSANHAGELDVARHIVEIASECGADAVKLQTYTPDTLTLDSDRSEFRVDAEGPWRGRRLYELYGEAHMPWDWQPELKQLADELGLILFSSAFDKSAIEFLVGLDVPAFKVASPEIVDIELIQRVAATGKPLILSTGMATRAEIDRAVAAARSVAGAQIALLKCTSAYPAPATDANLRTIPHMRELFDVPVGLSDHTLGSAVAVAAVALGAAIIEKHLCLDRSQAGPDSGFSLEPREFRSLVDAIRDAESALGCVRYAPASAEASNRQFRRSLFAVEEIRPGERLTSRNVRSIRPAHGLSPRHLPAVLGRTAARRIERGTPLRWDMLAPRSEIGT
jgi:pseudaminic acid synthase